MMYVTPLSPIVTLSLNPAIDLSYEIPSLLHDQKSRAITTRYDAGGTGINVGRALKQLNANAHTCYFYAGKMGRFLQEMLQDQLENPHGIQVQGETRINTTILQQSPEYQYEVNATGSPIGSQQLQQINQQFLALCSQGIGILTGSLPPNIDNNYYQLMNTALKKQGAKAIIDAPIQVLKQALLSQPFLIKPNLHELQILCQKQLTTLSQIATAARLIAQQGTQYICVSLGEQGAILATAETAYHCPSTPIKPRSTVGAGDSMVAGLAYGFSHELALDDILKLAVACGAGTAKQAGTQLFNPTELDSLISPLKITPL